MLWTGCGVSPVPYGIIGLKIGIPGVIAPYRRKHETETTDPVDSILVLREKVFRRSLEINQHKLIIPNLRHIVVTR